MLQKFKINYDFSYFIMVQELSFTIYLRTGIYLKYANRACKPFYTVNTPKIVKE